MIFSLFRVMKKPSFFENRLFALPVFDVIWFCILGNSLSCFIFVVILR